MSTHSWLQSASGIHGPLVLWDVAGQRMLDPPLAWLHAGCNALERLWLLLVELWWVLV